MEREFRIETDPFGGRRELTGRMLSWGVVVLLFATTVLLFILGFNGLLRPHPMLGYLLVFTLPGGMIGAIILVCREGLRRAEREMRFVLDDKAIMRKRSGFPNVKIGFSEIETLRDELRWLVIYGIESRTKIAVPNDVTGFEVIRSELAKHHPISARARFPWKSIVLPMVAILSWAALFFFRDLRILIPTGAIALTSLAIGFYRLWSLQH